MLFNSNRTSKSAEISRKLPRVENYDICREMTLFLLRNNFFNSIPETKTSNFSEIERNDIDENQKIIKCSARKGISSLPSESIFINPEFKLEFDQKINSPLCKGKYFSFKVSLKSLSSFQFPTNQKIELEVLVFTLDDILITKNMKGKDILRGNFIQNMTFFTLESMHVAFFRVQITEVSSHFIEKKFKLKIQARKSEFIKETGWKIQSLSISDIIVRAKGAKTYV